MSQTKPCPYCGRAIVETSRLCCFCGRTLNIHRFMESAVRAALQDDPDEVPSPGVVSTGRTNNVVHAFPAIPSGPAVGETGASGHTSSEPSAAPAPGAVTPSPGGRTSVFKTPPPIRVVVLLITSVLLLSVPEGIFPEASAWLELVRGFVSVGGQYWLLLAPFTARTPMILVAVALPLVLVHEAPGPSHSTLRLLDMMLMFLSMQALAISVLRAIRWRGRGAMAVSALDEKDGNSSTRVGSFDV
jgi:hypothetical protein